MIFGGLLGLWFVLCAGGSVLMARLKAPITPAVIAFYGAFSIAIAYMFSTVWWMNFGALSFALIVISSLLIIALNLLLLTRAPKKLDLSLGTFLLALACMVAIVWVLKADVRQHFAFDTWDAVVSWNRWATELLNDKFRPYPQPYPVLWPTLWSVIYAAQGGEVWQVLTKNAHLIVIVIASLVCWDLWRRRNAIAALVFAGAILLSTGELLDKFTWGYMDQPVALLIAAAVTAFFLLRDDTEPRQNRILVWLLPLWILGIAAVTKQAGWPMLAFGLSIVAYDYFQKRVSWRTVVVGLIGLLGPVLIFALFFSGYKAAIQGTSDQIDGLMTLSASRTQIDDGWQRGLALFVTIDDVADVIRLASLALMTVAAFFLKGRDRLIVALTAALVIFGSVGTGICCSYDDRNSGWLLALSIAGMTGAVASAQWPDRLKQTKAWQRVAPRFDATIQAVLKTRWSMDRRVLAVFVPLALVTAAIVETGSKEYITASENVMLNLGGQVGANALIADIERADGCRTVYSAHNMVRHNPVLARFKRRIHDAGDLKWFLHSGRSVDPKCQTYWYFKPGVYPQASQTDKELFKELLDQGKVKQLGGYAYRVERDATW